MLPEAGRADFEHFAKTVIFTADFMQVMSVIATILLVADVSLLAAALARFKRARLILD